MHIYVVLASAEMFIERLVRLFLCIFYVVLALWDMPLEMLVKAIVCIFASF